jgi:ribosome-associated protein
MQQSQPKPAFVEHAQPSMPQTRVQSKADDTLPSDPKLAFAIEAARMVRDDNCDDVVVLDVRNTSHVSDFIVIGSGTSDRQMRSVLEHVEKLGATRGFKAFRTSRDDRATWLLLDFVDVVVHLFEPATRSHYDLEMLWGDAPRIEWERQDQFKRDRAGVSS